MSRVFLTLLSILGLSLFTSSPIYADELTISGNGEGSGSNVEVSAPSLQTIDQSNSAVVTNNVSPQTNTGSNTTSGNTGGSNSINTGAANTTVEVQNKLNSSVVNTDCCVAAEGNSVQIIHNGQGSTNTTSLNTPHSTNVLITQNANLYNSVSGSINTGKNSASGGSGNVSIRTGNITASQRIINENINHAQVTAPQGGEGVSVKIASNGENSVNIVSLNDPTLNNLVVLNAATLRNALVLYANTGDNRADSSLGDVTITTGDVLVDTFVKNADINFSKVVINCCIAQTDTPSPPPPPSGGNGGGNSNPPSNSTNNTSSSSNSSSSTITSGQGGGPAVLGASAMMPATGSNWSIWLSLLSGIMFALGLYLRFHPGQDPGRILFFLTYQSRLA